MDTVEIIKNTPKAKMEFANRGWGQSEAFLTKEHIQALLDGKAIGIADGEYTTVLILEED